MKFTLFSFLEKYYKKIIFIASILITGFFIGIYRYIPASLDFEFIIYSLGIAYAFMFFLIGIFQTVITSSFERRYPLFKEQYVEFKELRTMMLFGRSLVEKYLEERKSKQKNNRYYDISIKTHPKFYLEIVGFIKEENDPRIINHTYTKLTKPFQCLLDFISKKEWCISNWLDRFIIIIYLQVLKSHDRKIVQELKRIEKIFGEKLVEDLQNEIQEDEDRNFIKEINSNINYLIEMLEDNETDLEHLRNELEDFRSMQEGIQDQLSDVLDIASSSNFTQYENFVEDE